MIFTPAPLAHWDRGRADNVAATFSRPANSNLSSVPKPNGLQAGASPFGSAHDEEGE
jgi:hypothetical protein